MRLSSVPYNATEVGLWMMVVIEQHAESLQPVGNQWMLPDVINLSAIQSFGGQHAESLQHVGNQKVTSLLPVYMLCIESDAIN